MELKLAIVQTCDNTGCRVHLLDGKQQVDTVYAQPILTYNLVIRPTDFGGGGCGKSSLSHGRPLATGHGQPSRGRYHLGR